MKVLLVNYEYPGVTSNCGGGGEVTRLLKKGVEAQGHDVVLVTDEADGHHLTFPFRVYKQIDRVLANQDIDVINGHFVLPSSLFLPRLSAKHDVPYVVTVMGADIYDPTRYTWGRPLLNTVAKRVLNSSDAVVAPSFDMAERTNQLYDGQTNVIHYGSDLSEWSESHSNTAGEYHVVTVGRLVERKNIWMAIEAVRSLRDRGVDASYRIVGTGPRELSLKRGSTMPDWLDFRGYVEDLQAEYDWGDVFLLPSKHEAFGMVFLEALASGLPVVTTPTGGQTDIVNHGANGQIRIADPEELAVGLETIFYNYTKYQSAARQSVDPYFSTERMAKDYVGLYTELQ
jgi:glycosyltransferase involved in cell wall biosynthesis